VRAASSALCEQAGAISTGGILLFLAVEFGVTGSFPKGPVFHLMVLPGILFLLSGFMRSRRAARGGSTS
jgi:hypothetical protein